MLQDSMMVIMISFLFLFVSETHSSFVFQHFAITCHALNGSLEKTDSGYQIDGPDYTGMSHITPHITDINTTTHSYELPFCGFNKLFYSATK